jgi:hypothetical protein
MISLSIMSDEWEGKLLEVFRKAYSVNLAIVRASSALIPVF